jgi:sugar lactone lactonase YvrE
MKWTPGEGVTLFSARTNEANGMTRDPQGRLVACEHAAQRVTRLERDGRTTVVGDCYQGKRLNRPNDVVVTSDFGQHAIRRERMENPALRLRLGRRCGRRCGRTPHRRPGPYLPGN